MGSIDLSGALSIERTVGGKPGMFQITMKSTSRVWYLQAPKAEEAGTTRFLRSILHYFAFFFFTEQK
jgi:hypothetical protein